MSNNTSCFKNYMKLKGFIGIAINLSLDTK